MRFGHRAISRLAILLALVVSFLPHVQAGAEEESDAVTATLEPFIRADGSLSFPEDFTGALAVPSLNVVLDPNKGPLFSPPQLSLGEWAAVGTGSGGDGSLNNTVNALAMINGDLYVGGSFTNVVNNGVTIGAADFIAKWDGTNWSALGYGSSPSNGSLNAAVNALAVIGTDLYVGGSFQDVNNYGTTLTAADRIAKWDGSNWSAVGNGSGTQGSIGNTINALAVIGTDLFVGGSFLDVNNNGVTLGAADKVAMWDGSNWSALGYGNSSTSGAIGATSTVNALEAIGTDLYIGGNFTSINNYGTPLNAAARIAKWDGSNWSALGSNGSGGPSIGNNQVLALEGIGTELYVGGSFTALNNNGTGLNAAARIARWNGSSWSALGYGSSSTSSPVDNGQVSALLASGGHLYVGGTFQNVNNYGSAIPEADRLAKWDGTNWSALGSNGGGQGSLGAAVNALALLNGDLYVGGAFVNANNNGIALGAADRIAYVGLSDAAIPEYSGSPAIGETLSFTATSGSAPELNISVTNSGDDGSELSVSLDSISPGYSIAVGLPISNLLPSDPAATIIVACDSVPQADGTLTLTTNDPGNTSIDYQLTCTAVDPAYSSTLLPGSILTFSGITGTVPPSQDILISNVGDPESSLNVALDDISSGYGVTGLPSNDQQTADPAINITVSCDSIPQDNGTLTVSTNDPSNTAVIYNLECVALDPEFVSNPLPASELAFTGITGTTPSNEFIEVGNEGDLNSTLDVGLGSISSGYSVVGGLPISGLEPGDPTASIEVGCDQVDQLAGTLSLITNDPGNPSVVFDLSCIAMDPGYSSTPAVGSTLTFSGVTGSNPSLIIDVNNAGDSGSELEVSLDSIGAGYSINGLPVSSLQTTDASATFIVECDSVPQADATLTLSTNDPANGTVTYDLECAAMDPTFSSDPALGTGLDFSGLTGTIPPTLSIVVNNSGDSGSSLDVALDSITTGYTLVSGLPISGLGSSDPSVNIKVQCDSAPQSDGTLTLTTNDSNNPGVEFGLTCTAIDPAFASDPLGGSTLLFTGITGSTPPSQDIDVSNIGDSGSELNVDVASISSGYSIVGGLPIDGLETTDSPSAISVECDTAPQAGGTLILSTNDPLTPAVSFDLNCGTQDPTYSSDPPVDSILAFAGISGTTPTLSIEISNIGDAGSTLDANLDSIGIGYSVVSGLPIENLQATDSSAIVTIQCDSVAQADATLTLNTNDLTNESVSYDLTCTSQNPAFTSDPSAGSTLEMFGASGDSTTSTVQVTNTGETDSTLQVEVNSISAGYNIESGLPVDGLDVSGPAAQFVVKCSSVPTADGALELTTNDPANPTVDYVLSCELEVEKEKTESKKIEIDGTTKFSFGRIFVSLPASAIPSGLSDCKIVITSLGRSEDDGFVLDDIVYDVKVVCDSGPLEILFSPLTVCIRPLDGVTVNKHVFHQHGNSSTFTILPDGDGLPGYVCGTTQILSLFTLGELQLPDTGFAPGTVTSLPEQPPENGYLASDLILEIPSMSVSHPIVGVPMVNGEWDVTWLGLSAGYLYGTAFPTWVGNSVITAHVWNADNSAGPFHNLRTLGYGDQFYIHAFGSTYAYEVRSNRLVSAGNLGVMSDSEYSLVTLLTCESFDESKGNYTYRRAVQAVLVDVR